MQTPLFLLICGLATWRMAVLISDDTGPMKIFSRFRAFLKREEKTSKALRKSDVAAGIICKKCSSVWLAIPIAPYAYLHDGCPTWLTISGDICLLMLALSAVAILAERALPPK